jgi:hypothetical protein
VRARHGPAWERLHRLGGRRRGGGSVGARGTWRRRVRRRQQGQRAMSPPFCLQPPPPPPPLCLPTPSPRFRLARTQGLTPLCSRRGRLCGWRRPRCAGLCVVRLDVLLQQRDLGRGRVGEWLQCSRHNQWNRPRPAALPPARAFLRRAARRACDARPPRPPPLPASQGPASPLDLRIKILVIGLAGSGKTQLIRSLLGGPLAGGWARARRLGRGFGWGPGPGSLGAQPPSRCGRCRTFDRCLTGPGAHLCAPAPRRQGRRRRHQRGGRV